MTGLDKARKTAEQLKPTEEPKEEIKAIRADDPVLKALMAEDARTEMSEGGGSLPFLKVFITNRSQATLADGKEPNNGWFYYTPTQEQYETVHAHLLYISRGFWMEGMPDEQGQVKKRYTHVVSGIMVNDEPKPFWLLVSGQARLQRLWDFLKDKSKVTARGIPLFALLVILSTEKVKTEKSPAMVVNFKIEEGENGMPWLVSDKDQYLEHRSRSLEQKKFVEEWIKRKDVGIHDDAPAVELPTAEPPAELPSAETKEIPF